MHQKSIVDKQIPVTKCDYKTRRTKCDATTRHEPRTKTPYRGWSDRGDNKKCPKPEEKQQPNPLPSPTILPDTEQELLKYLENLNRRKLAEKEKQAKNARMEKLSGRDASGVDHVKNNVLNAHIPRALLRSRHEHSTLRSTEKWIDTVPQPQPTARVRLVSRAVSTMTKNDKTVVFHRKTPLEIKLPVTKKIIKSSDSQPKNSEKQSAKKLSQKIPRHKRSESPLLDRKCNSPMTEVAKWSPHSVTGLTRPYYEAWVDTKLSAAVYHTTELPAEEKEEESIEWNDKRMLGTIRVRR